MKFERTARVWKRLLAFLVDLYLGLAACSAFFIVIQGELPTDLMQAFDHGLTPLAIAAFIYASLFLLLYHTFSEYIVGQTPGMLLFGIVVKVRQPKRELGFWQSLGRNIFLLPVFPLTLLWIIEPVYFLFQGERLMDRWTNTTLIET